MAGIIGKKIGMTQVFLSETEPAGVTVIEAGPCPVLKLREAVRDGLRSIQIGFEEKKASRTSKADAGQFKPAKCAPQKCIREIRLAGDEKFQVGDTLRVGIFKAGDLVDIVGLSKGKGFQGGMRRWNWKGGGASHGSTSRRRPGSIGSNTTPGRVFRGHHLPGRMGGDRCTVQNLTVVKIDEANNLLVVRGAVPGPANGYLLIRKAKKAKAAAAKKA